MNMEKNIKNKFFRRDLNFTFLLEKKMNFLDIIDPFFPSCRKREKERVIERIDIWVIETNRIFRLAICFISNLSIRSCLFVSTRKYCICSEK